MRPRYFFLLVGLALLIYGLIELDRPWVTALVGGIMVLVIAIDGLPDAKERK